MDSHEEFRELCAIFGLWKTSPKKKERGWRSINRAEDLVQEKCESDSLSLSQDSFTPVRSNKCSDWYRTGQNDPILCRTQ
jgi:hypothetical protein